MTSKTLPDSQSTIYDLLSGLNQRISQTEHAVQPAATECFRIGELARDGPKSRVTLLFVADSLGESCTAVPKTELQSIHLRVSDLSNKVVSISRRVAYLVRTNTSRPRRTKKSQPGPKEGASAKRRIRARPRREQPTKQALPPEANSNESVVVKADKTAPSKPDRSTNPADCATLPTLHHIQNRHHAVL